EWSASVANGVTGGGDRRQCRVDRARIRGGRGRTASGRLIGQRGHANDGHDDDEDVERAIAGRRLGRLYDSLLSSSSGFHSLLCHRGEVSFWASRTIRRLSAISGVS